ncbi:amidase [uncultured Corynebacterium sp.]|uniref:amidase family protein n=1 Tax=uncultured Corynebacterium sp. TaxID=159447 RepID=UPI0025EB3A4C|nr:amidase [uncultured Corynebacterium sp.]
MDVIQPLTQPTARDIAARVRSGTMTPEESVRVSLDAIAAMDGAVNAFVEVWADRAIRDARDLAKRPDLGDLGLAGVPFALKQNTDRGNPFVKRLEAAGAIPVGTTANPQFCTWGTTDVPGRTVRNPIRPGRTPGGSSGGAAAAVAAGMVPFAQGNDGMGSLRIPAAACNLSTIKATPGIMPGRVGGNDWYGMSVQGVIAQDNDDLTLLMREITLGHVDAVDAPLPERFGAVLDLSSPVAGFGATREWAGAARMAAKTLADADLPVREAKAPYPLNPLPMLARWTASVANELRDQGLPDHLEWRNRVHARIGRSLRWSIKDRQVLRARAKMEKFLAGDNVLITPALATEPPSDGPWNSRPWSANLVSNLRYAPYVSVWNLLGFPAGVVVEPVTGVPVQVVARMTQERVLLTAMDRIAAGGVRGSGRS